jgi:alpha/beta superfamily hydrolase
MRYNQRGIGRSKGRRFSFKNLRGDQDATDVPHMVEFLSTQLSSATSPSSTPLNTSTKPKIVVIGYSFGACLASYALQDPRVVLYIGVSFPLGGLTALLQTKKGFDIVCRARHVPRLLVLGSDDQYTKLVAMEEAMKAGGGVRIVEEEENIRNIGAGGSSILAGSPPAVVAVAEQQQANGKKPLLLKVFNANAHFWETDLALMAEFCLGWIEQQLSSDG